MAAALLRPMPRMIAIAIAIAALLAAAGIAGIAGAAPDPGKKACAREARYLCPAEMKSMSRKRVEACMIARIDQTSAICHSAMLRIKAEREAAVKP